jgi:hypothetical protein
MKRADRTREGCVDHAVCLRAVAPPGRTGDFIGQGDPDSRCRDPVCALKARDGYTNDFVRFAEDPDYSANCRRIARELRAPHPTTEHGDAGVPISRFDGPAD